MSELKQIIDTMYREFESQIFDCHTANSPAKEKPLNIDTLKDILASMPPPPPVVKTSRYVPRTGQPTKKPKTDDMAQMVDDIGTVPIKVAWKFRDIIVVHPDNLKRN